MDSDKTIGANQTEFHKENISAKLAGTVRLENAVSDIQIKLGMLEQMNLKLTSLKKDIMEIYSKVDTLEEAGFAPGKSELRRSKDDIPGREETVEKDVKSIQESIKLVDDKLAVLGEIQNSVKLLEQSGISQEKINSQLAVSLEEMKRANQELSGLQDLSTRLKVLDDFSEKLLVLDEIGDRLKKLDQFVKLKSVLETIGEKLKKLDTVDNKITNVDEKLSVVKEKLTSIDQIYDRLRAIEQIDEKLAALEVINQKLSKLESINLGLQAGHLIREAIKPLKASAESESRASLARSELKEDEIPEGIDDEFEEDEIPEGIDDEFEEDEIPEGIDDEFEEEVIPEGIDDEFEEEVIPEGIDDEFEEEVIPEGIDDEFEEDEIPEGIDDEFEEDEIPEGIDDEFEEDALEGDTDSAETENAKSFAGAVISDDLSGEDKELIEQLNNKLSKLDEIEAKLDILEEFDERLEMLEDLDEQLNYIRDFMDDKLDLDYVAMYETLREEVHEDAIKTYRNIQAVIVEENAKQNHVLFGVDGNQDKLKFRMNHVMIFSIISFVTSILVMLIQILPALGIDLF